MFWFVFYSSVRPIYSSVKSQSFNPFPTLPKLANAKYYRQSLFLTDRPSFRDVQCFTRPRYEGRPTHPGRHGPGGTPWDARSSRGSSSTSGGSEGTSPAICMCTGTCLFRILRRSFFVCANYSDNADAPRPPLGIDDTSFCPTPTLPVLICSVGRNAVRLRSYLCNVPAARRLSVPARSVQPTTGAPGAVRAAAGCVHEQDHTAARMMQGMMQRVLHARLQAGLVLLGRPYLPEEWSLYLLILKCCQKI